MRRILLAGAAMLLSTLTATAVPAKPVKKTVRQADGTTIELTLRGDEHYSYYTGPDGQPYQLKADGQLVPLTMQAVSETWAARREARMNVAGARSRGVRQAGLPSSSTTGKHRGLVILMQFQDVPFETENAQQVYNRFFNEEGYSEDGMTGSVRDYFLKQSYGLLEIDFDVVGPYTTKREMAYYGGHSSDGGNDKNAAGMVAEAVDSAAVHDVADFSVYDWDGDGEVDQVFVVYAGYNEAQGADANTIWPHEWVLEGAGLTKKYNGVTINTYGCSSELMGNGKTYTGHLDGIGTACHEFSHCLGLPDMYDTNYNNFGMGNWDVMCSGSYNNNSHTPAGYTSYERMFAGWLKPTELKDMTRIEGMKPLATNAEAYILYNEKNKNEYYLLENRQAVDFDAGLSGHGLLVLHVDYNRNSWMANTVNNSTNHERMTIIPADGKKQETRTSLAGDPFPGTTKNTALTNYTDPAATLYGDNIDGTKLMSKPLDNIKESSSGLISFVACRPELGIPEPDGGAEVEGQSAFTVTWPAVSGATSYELELTEVGAAAATPEEALEREFTFDGLVSKSVGLSDVSSKLSSYGLSGWTGSNIYTSPNKMKLGTSTKTGSVRTTTWQVPQSSEMTVVMGADVVKEGDVVKGTLSAAFGNAGDQAEYDRQSFEVSGLGYQVFNFSIRKDLFWLEIAAEKQMYLNYLAIYDGIWTLEQLGLDKAAARQEAPRKVTKVTTHTTETNSITLKDLDTGSRFIYKVRAIGEESTYSQWSEEHTFQFSGSAGINGITMDAQKDQRIYDLHGRQVTNPTKGIYIIGGKKVVK